MEALVCLSKSKPSTSTDMWHVFVDWKCKNQEMVSIAFASNVILFTPSLNNSTKYRRRLSVKCKNFT